MINFKLTNSTAMFTLKFRLSEQAVELNRLLERVYKQSQCIDVESLCIVTGEKVIITWNNF